jgi:hypothetical protein
MMGIDLTGIIAQAGPWGATLAVTLTVIMALIRGDLVPRKAHESALAQRDAVILAVTEDRNFLRDRLYAVMGLAQTSTDVADNSTRMLLQRGLTRGEN